MNKFLELNKYLDKVLIKGVEENGKRRCPTREEMLRIGLRHAKYIWGSKRKGYCLTREETAVVTQHIFFYIRAVKSECTRRIDGEEYNSVTLEIARERILERLKEGKKA